MIASARRTPPLGTTGSRLLECLIFILYLIMCRYICLICVGISSHFFPSSLSNSFSWIVLNVLRLYHIRARQNSCAPLSDLRALVRTLSTPPPASTLNLREESSEERGVLEIGQEPQPNGVEPRGGGCDPARPRDTVCRRRCANAREAVSRPRSSPRRLQPMQLHDGI